MKAILNRSFLACLLVSFFVLASCSAGGSGSSTAVNSASAGSSAGSVSGDASGTIQSLPDFQVNVPQSLGGSADLKLKLKLKLKSRQRAIGDISVFNPAGLPDVQSQGWKNMSDAIGAENEVSFVLRGIKTWASNHSIPFNVATNITMTTSGIQPKNLNGKVLCTNLNPGETSIFLTLSNSATGTMVGAYSFYIYTYILAKTNAAGKSEVVMISRQAPLATGMMPDPGIDQMQNTVYYSVFRETNSENVGITRLLQSSMSGTETNIRMKKSWLKPDQSVVILCVNQNPGSWDSLTVACGDNVNGGLIERTVNYGVATNDTLYSEFYNSTGGLMFCNEGVSELNNTAWMDYYTTSGLNLKDYGYSAYPNNLTVTSSNLGGGSYQIIITNGSTLLPVTNVIETLWFDIYGKAASNWNTGDCVYAMTHSAWENGSAVFEFARDYTVPGKTAYLGRPYYMDNTWPLKYLELEAAYSNYAITRQVDYEDRWTNIWTNESNLADIVTNSGLWQRFNWWLDQARDSVYQTSSDLMLRSISERDFWLYDPATYICEQQKGLMVKGSGVAPRFFRFTRQPAVDSVSATLNGIYSNDALPLNVFNYYDTLPSMPASNMFPVP